MVPPKFQKDCSFCFVIGNGHEPVVLTRFSTTLWDDLFEGLDTGLAPTTGSLNRRRFVRVPINAFNRRFNVRLLAFPVREDDDRLSRSRFRRV